jgi:aryl-alcohol dehydrogenase-like predicted oxidoreductase
MNMFTLSGILLPVSPLSFGCGSLGTGAKRETALTLVREYFAAGGNFFDTAHCYAGWAPEGAGVSERELGRCVRELGIRQQCVIASKGGHPGYPGYPRPDDFLAESVIASDIEESLNRLQMEVIDLYYLHRDDGKRPVGEIIEQLNGEIERGRLRALGASNWSVERIAEANAYAHAHGLQGFCISQVQWSLASPKWHTESFGPDPVNRTLGQKDLKFHIAADLPIAAYSATVGGYFADTEAGNRTYDTDTNRARRERARELATQLGATPTQVALAWLLCQPVRTVPVFGTNRPEHLQEIMGAVDVRLTPEQIRWLWEGEAAK